MLQRLMDSLKSLYCRTKRRMRSPAFPEALEGRVLLSNLRLDDAFLIDGAGQRVETVPVGGTVSIRADFSTFQLASDDQYIVRYSVDGVSLHSPLLDYGAGVSFDTFYRYRYNWYASPGSHSVTVTLDSSNRVAESNERDNSLTFRFKTSLPVSLPQKLSWPIGGRDNIDWVVTNYADVDPRDGRQADYRGGAFQYDNHDAIDITLPTFQKMDQGIPVLAAADGIVRSVKDGFFDRETSRGERTGNSVLVDHGNGWSTFYLHFARNSIAVRAGQRVRAGLVLGLVGSSGDSTAPHLHFNLRYHDLPVEVHYAPGSYFLRPRAYQGAMSPRVMDSGITDHDPRYALPERPTVRTTFSVSQPEDVWFWYRATHAVNGSELLVKWYRPNGTVFDTETLSVVGTWRYLNHAWRLSGSDAARHQGKWNVVLSLDGRELVRTTFLVRNTPDAPEIRVQRYPDEIHDGRMTPVDFGTVKRGASAPWRSFTVRNDGDQPLKLSGLQLPRGFRLLGSFPREVPGNSVAVLSIQMDTVAVADRLGEVRFRTNDSDNSVFEFLISGVVTGSQQSQPLISISSPAVIHNPGSFTTLFSSVKVLNVGSSFAGSRIIASTVGGFSTGDRLSLQTQGQITVSGTQIRYAGSIVGELTGGSSGSPLTILLNSRCTLSIAEAIGRSLVYSTSSSNRGRRIVSLRLEDSAGLSGLDRYRTVVFQ